MIKKLKRRKVYARFNDNILDLAEIGSLPSFNHVVKYLLSRRCFRQIWVKPLKHRNAKTILHGFAEIENESKRKPYKLWVYQGIEFYDSPIRPTLYCVILAVFNLKV